MRHERVLVVPQPLCAVALVDPAAPLVETNSHTASPRKDEESQESRIRREEHEVAQRVLAGLSEIAGELQVQQRQRLEEMQQMAVELAVAIASRLLHARLEANECGVVHLVREAVEQLATDQPIRIFLHPLDLQLLEKQLATVTTLDASKLRLAADNTLKRGECRADAGEHSVRSLLEEQLGAIRRNLLETLPDARSDRRAPVPVDRSLRRFPDRRYTA